MGERIRIGIVGCGEIANYLHAPAIALSKRCELVAAVDNNIARANRLGSITSNLRTGHDLVDIERDVDAIVLATPPHVRYELFKRATQLGIHVLSEKPLANTVAECESICRITEASEIVSAVCHQFRFWPNRMRIRELIASEQLSVPKRITVEQGGVYSWNAATGYTVRKELVSGGVLINAGTHPMDTLISWFGDPISFEYHDDACGGLESNAMIQAQFPGPVECSFRISRTCLLENKIQLHWADKSISLTNNDPFRYWLKQNGRVSTATCGNPSHGYLQPAADLYDDFASAIIDGRSPEVSIREGIRVIRWVEECYKQKRCRALPTIAIGPGLVW